LELAQAGTPFTVIGDGAAVPLIAAGRVKAILVGAWGIAANGDTRAAPGTYALAVAAKHHGIPFSVCATLLTVDYGAPTGSAVPLAGPLAASESPWHPVADLVPADLVTNITTDRGVVRPPLKHGLAEARERGEIAPS
jgi:methylthioribose-1-phosphate isomerase